MIELNKLNRIELVERIKCLIATERKTTAELIEALKELDRRRLYLEMGYSSLFAYLTEGLGYTPASAMRRISAARLAQQVPEVKEALEEGKLNLMQLSVVAQGIRNKQKAGVKVCAMEKRNLLDKVKEKNFASTQKLVASELKLEIRTEEKVRPQEDDSVWMSFHLTKDQMKTIERAKELLSHKHVGASWAELMTAFAEDVIRLRDPRREPKGNRNAKQLCNEQLAPAKESKKISNSSTENPEFESSQQSLHSAASTVEYAASKSNGDPKKTRFEKLNERRNFTRTKIPTALARKIHQGADCCQYVDPKSGRKCGSRFQLQIDHRTPVWAGGGNEKENLRILCGPHNREKYRWESGRRRI